MTFEDDEVASIIRIGIDNDLQKVMKKFAIVCLVKVKTHVGFTLCDHILSLTFEEAVLVLGVRVIVE